VILVIARPLDLIRLAIQKKSLFHIKSHRANSKFGLRPINDLVVPPHRRNQFVQARCFRRPQLLRRCEGTEHALHRAVHEEGYQVERQPDGELHFRRPDGRLLPEVPPPAATPTDPVQALRGRHDAQGLRIDARTSTPAWLGERLDVGWAIDVLHPRALTPARSAT